MMVLGVLGLAVVGAGGAAALVLAGLDIGAGLSVAASGILLVVAGRLARRANARRLLFADSSIERVVEGVVLAAIAWERLSPEPRTAVAALLALGSGYVASYLKARATSLGFRLEESILDRGVRTAMIAMGLVSGGLELGLWAAAAWSVATTATRALQVAGQEEQA